MKLRKIRIHYSLLFLIIMSMYIGKLFEISLFILIILLHECGHIIFIKLFGGKINKIELSLVGGIIDVNFNSKSYWKNMLVNFGRPGYECSYNTNL